MDESCVRLELLARDPKSNARRARIHTPHGLIETPIFMPVGTLATVKAMGPDDLKQVQAQIILGNTYHLMLRPGEDLIRELGGLHRFMSWDRPVLTDSGGFQVFSLAQKRTLTEEGVAFQSHYDGSFHHLTPERSIEIQGALGADIIMAFDECPPALSERSYLELSLARTTRWLTRCVQQWRASQGRSVHSNVSSLFGIVQGGLHLDLRRRHAEEICAMDLPGYALGGYSVGEEPEAMHQSIAETASILPKDKPRYLMGVGTPVDLIAAVVAGIDMFDCVLPTRCARNGLLFTSTGKLNIKNAVHARDPRPIDKLCGCYTCQNFSRAYLRHLFQAKEILAMRLNTIHNLFYYLDLMRQMRDAIESGELLDLKKRIDFAYAES